MSLPVGTRLGSYEILSALGAGGMGEVYRARDTRLDRDVAIKILPQTFAADADRISRFQREAKVLASLNHPHIAAVYGLEDSDRGKALVMELVEGEDLAERLARGALPLDETLPIAKQIAEALEAAHEQGIVHRDLKPANVKVRPDGTVKVLDFGLAKLSDATGSGLLHASALLQSPTIASPAVITGVGMLLGTAAYMSPEQAKGRSADKRSDVWAFGCVLYEMLTGRRAFEGDGVAETLGAIIHKEPEWHALPAGTPRYLRTVLRRCLQKDPKKRLPHIGLARLEIDEGQPDAGLPHGAAGSVAPSRPWKHAVPIAAVVVAGALGAWAGWYVHRPTPPAVMRFSIALGQDQNFTGQGRRSMAISADGTQIAYVADRKLFRRSLSDGETHLVVNDEETLGAAINPAFSPDGRSIAFVATQDRTLRRISVDGGTSVTVCSLAALPYGVSWDEAGILFEADGSIMRVSADGGKPETLIARRTSDRLRSPQMLPDGRTVLFTLVDATVNTSNITSNAGYPARIVAQSLTSSEPQVLIESGMEGRYLPTGHLAYTSRGVLFAVPFDVRRLQVTGGPVPLVQGIRSEGGTAYYTVSATGTLMYVPGTELGIGGQQNLGLIDRSGKVDLLKLAPATLMYPRFSPDGTQVAVEIDNGNDANIWIYELSGASALRRLTFGGRNRVPAWSADGQRVAFQSDRDGDLAIYAQRADGAGDAQRLTTPEKGAAHVPESWSLKGELLFTATKGPDSTLWTYSARDRTVRPFGSVRSSGQPSNAAFSPNGLWVAYQSNETGSPAVYVQPFPATGARFQASLDSPGDDPHHPLWSRDGTELFYVARPNRFVVTSVTQHSGLSFSDPVAIPTGMWKNTFGGPTTIRNYDVSPDGKHFIGVIASGVTTESGTPRAPQIDVVLNWLQELKQRVPVR